jgi:SOS-response transcriptional repressor LexA
VTKTKTAPPARAALTDKQREILRYTLGYFLAHVRYPSFREIMHAFGLASPNAVNGHIKALVKKGWLTRAKNPGDGKVMARAYQVTGMLERVAPVVEEFAADLLAEGGAACGS